MNQKTIDMTKAEPGKDAAKLLDKAICLLNFIAANNGGRLTITEMSKKLGISRSTMYRILETLTSHQFLIRDEDSGQYCLGWELCYLGDAAQKSNSLYSILHSHLTQLSAQFRETVSLSLLNKGVGIIIDSIRGTHAPLVVDVTLGIPEPLYATAYGKALISDHSEAELIQLFENRKLPAITNSTLTSVGALYEQLCAAKKLGYYMVVDEYVDGVSAMACPIRNFSGKVAAAVSVAIPTVRMTPGIISKLSGELIVASKEMSKNLGYQ